MFFVRASFWVPSGFFPFGYVHCLLGPPFCESTKLAGFGRSRSGGEQRRLALACALAGEATPHTLRGFVLLKGSRVGIGFLGKVRGHHLLVLRGCMSV